MTHHFDQTNSGETTNRFALSNDPSSQIPSREITEQPRGQPTLKPLFYVVMIKDNQYFIYDSNFNLIKKPLNGFYTSIHYHNLLVIGHLIDYGSGHGGLHMMLQVARMFMIKYRHHLFAREPQAFKLPSDNPIAGGGVFFYGNQIIFFHLKSGLYSQNNRNCHDNDPQRLKAFILTLNLPESRYISVNQAEDFEKHELRQFFSGDGQCKNSSQFELQIDFLCKKLRLSPIKPHATRQVDALYPSRDNFIKP